MVGCEKDGKTQFYRTDHMAPQKDIASYKEYSWCHERGRESSGGYTAGSPKAQ